MLCLMISLVVWIEFFYIQLYFNIHLPDIHLQSLYLFLLVSLFVLWVYVHVRKMLLRKLKLEHFQQKASLFYANPHVFHLYMNNAPELLFPDKLDCISNISANENPLYTFSLITSLTCPVCAKNYLELSSLLKEKENIGVSIVLFAPANHKEETEVAAIIAGIYLEKGWDKAHEALHAWYSHKYRNTKTWKKHMKVKNKLEGAALIQQYREYCAMNNIDAFPKVMMNDKTIPKLYTLKDIKYLI